VEYEFSFLQDDSSVSHTQKKTTSYATARDIYVFGLSVYHKGSRVATLRMAKGTTQRVAMQQRRFLPRSNFLPP
jgi:hypothetical protein